MFNSHFSKIILYAFGIFITGLGVNLLLRSTFGAGAWDAVNEHSSLILNISLGTASLITNITILLFIMIANKSFKYLITLIPIFSIAISMDVWDLIIFSNVVIDSTGLYILSYILGSLLLPLGLAFMISTHYPSMVYDELTFILMKIFKVKTFLYVRWGVEGFAILLGIVLGIIAGVGLGTIGIGSIMIAFIIGPLITFYIHVLKKIT
jgi:uncharacterized membrane protein YczE